MRLLVHVHDERTKISNLSYSAKVETEEYKVAEVSVDGPVSLIAAALRAAADSLEGGEG